MSKWGMVLDLTRCAGCYSCVVSCKMENNTRPGLNWNEVQKVEWGNYPDAHQVFMSNLCMHCENPPCVQACPAGATYKREDGIVMTDYEKCIGCGYCIPACPYNARQINETESYNFEEPTPYELAGIQRINVAEKCIFCYQRVDQGKMPACVTNCPGKCRIFGDLDDPNSDINKYIKARDAHHVEGTSIYYVLPEGMDLSNVPPGCIQPAYLNALTNVAQPVGKAALGLAAAAVVGGVVLHAVKGGDKNNE
jgi:molybdopterin-containing oxidoreductase family iron-sulfur binding subunit